MGSQKPIIGGYKADLVAVILDRECAQQLALALAWALGSTGGGKSKSKAGYPGAMATGPTKSPKSVGESKRVGTKKPSAVSDAAPATKAGATKAGATKTAARKSGAKKSGGSK